MGRKEIIKKIALWAVGASVVCVGGYFAPRIARSVGDAIEASQQNTALPKITIDSEGYDLSCAPRGVVGKEYRVFNATAKDNYGNDLKVAQKVWLYYYSSTKSRVSITDGVFTPQQVGEYVIEYTAVDSDGNKASVIYEVNCVESDGLSISLGEKIQAGVAGIKMQVAESVIQNISGNYTVNIQAKHKEINDIHIIGEDLSFCPMYAGTYVIEYSCSDYITTVSSSYEIVVAANETPVFFEEAQLPKYFVQNKEYQLDIPQAYHFAMGAPVEIEPVITIHDQYGNSLMLENGEFIPTTAGEIVVTYTVSYGDNTQELSYPSKVVDVDYGMLNSYHKYFNAENYTVTLSKEGVSLFTMTDNAQAEFINPILVNKANVIFSASAKYKNYDSLEVYFTDSIDSSIQVKFTFRDKQEGGMIYSVNDSVDYSSSASLFSGEKLELSYSNDNQAFNLNSTLDVFVRKTLSEENFYGFPSGKMYVSFRLIGVDGAAAFSVHKFNNQNFDLNAMDSVPEIVFTKHEGGEMNIGDIVDINPFYVGDVLDYDSLIKFYVIDPQGNYVTALDGTLLDGNDVDYYKQYSIIMEMVGMYNICMEISDTMGNMQLYAYGITTVDRTPPTILLTPGKTECKVGESIALWTVKATDASGEELETYVYAYTPDGKLQQLQDDRFYGEKAGIYAIYYQAMDTNGNSAMQYYEIVVS